MKTDKYKTKKCYACGMIGDFVDIEETPVCATCGWDSTKHPQSWDATHEVYRQEGDGGAGPSFAMELSGERESIGMAMRRHKEGLPIPETVRETEEQKRMDEKTQRRRKERIVIREDGVVEIHI